MRKGLRALLGLLVVVVALGLVVHASRRSDADNLEGFDISFEIQPRVTKAGAPVTLAFIIANPGETARRIRLTRNLLDYSLRVWVYAKGGNALKEPDVALRQTEGGRDTGGKAPGQGTEVLSIPAGKSISKNLELTIERPGIYTLTAMFLPIRPRRSKDLMAYARCSPCRVRVEAP